jgi:osmotically inducible lipoprotein OsmB
MRIMWKIGAVLVILAAAPATQAGTLEGAAIGAGTGAVVGGPVGAVVGGAAGAVIGGPNIVTRRGYRHRTCWRNSRGQRVCRYR